jgi:hypothetical protein
METKKTWKTLGILSIVFAVMGGVLSLFGSIGMYTGIFALLLGVGSLFMASKQGGKYTLAIVGIILAASTTFAGYKSAQAWGKAATEFEESLKNIDLEKEIENS